MNIVDHSETITVTYDDSVFPLLEVPPTPFREPRPPLLVKLTGYRLLNILIVVAFVVPKAVLAYEGNSVIPTSLEWIAVGVVGLAIWWLGLYQDIYPPVLPWLFSRDYSHDIIFAITHIVRISTDVFYGIFRRLAYLTNQFLQDKIKYFVLGSGFCILCWDVVFVINVVKSTEDDAAIFREGFAFCGVYVTWSFITYWKFGI